MSRAKYSDEFKAQVVRELIEKDRTIASVTASYEPAPQTVGIWVAKYKNEHGSAEEKEAATEAAEVARLKKQVRELQQGCEFLKKATACLSSSLARSSRHLATQFPTVWANRPSENATDAIAQSFTGHFAHYGDHDTWSFVWVLIGKCSKS